MTQINPKRQESKDNDKSTNQLAEELQMALDMIAKLETRCCQADTEKASALQTAAEALQENYIISQLISNPNITDKEKVGCIAYYQWYISTKSAKENGARYFSLKELAARLGWPRTEPDKPSKKEQAFSPIHTKLKNAGLILSTPEHQKNNPSRQNDFDLMLPQYTLSAGSFAFEQSDKASNRGGRRIALHRECGGQCVERVEYACMKCGRAHIDSEHVLLIDEEKWDSWQKESTPCPHCDEMVPQGVKFCFACGAALAEEVIVDADELVADLQAFTEEIQDVDSPPTSEPPQRDCIACTVRYGKPIRAWRWDLREGRWMCNNMDEHGLPKVEGGQS